ncbi:SDR family NAD(P)-dependent oxidoreductase [Mesorhizobium sp. M7A.F.Ca.US.006.04.2.1]|nr:SDR family NAD(P)-dependent oxidoreductase [Mesorhizobium sp. M7A.F.Ca.US.006.04.2.1]
MRLEGKAAIVTGASAGIGAAVTELFAKEGARVLVVDRDGARAGEVAGRTGALAWEADVSDEVSVATMVRRAQEAFGGWTFWSTMPVTAYAVRLSPPRRRIGTRSWP